MPVPTRPLNIRVTPQTSNLQASDFTYLGALRFSKNFVDIGSDQVQVMTGRRVGSQNRIFISQNRSGAFVGRWSVAEYADPGTYNTNYQLAPICAVVTNWGYSSGAPYDMWGGFYGKTYDAGGNLVGFGGLQCLPSGLAFKSTGGVDYLYMTYGLEYGNYVPGWSIVAAILANPGTGSTQPVGLSTTPLSIFRACCGVVSVGSATQEAGPNRTGYLFDLPDGSMGIAAGPLYTQQNRTNQGPSLWGGGVNWITTATPQGFGAPRGGNPSYRTTDLVPAVNYLSHYSMAGRVNVITGQTAAIWSMRRPAHVGGGFTNYFFEGFQDAVTGVPTGGNQVDPVAYAGVGSYTECDSLGGATYIGSGKSGFLAALSVSVGHTWYKTVSALGFRRAQAEWTSITQSGQAAAIVWTVAAGERNSVPPSAQFTYYLHLTFANPGAINQPLSVSVSGHTVTVQLATNGSGGIISTAAQVCAAVAAHAPAAALLSGTPSGGGSDIVSPTSRDIGGGPQNCPRHNVDSGITVTGPNTTAVEPAILVYHANDLQKTPDYSADPSFWLWLHDLFPTMQFSTSGATRGKIGGIWFEPVTRKLYLLAVAADLTTSPGDQLPLVHVFQVA